MDKIFITLLIGILGGLLGHKTGLPSGTLLGAMLAVGVFNMTTGSGKLPTQTSLVTQILVGTIIGLNFNIGNLKAISQLILPSVITVIGLMSMSIILGVILYKTTGLDLVTALFSTCPGGLTSMTLVANEYGAQTEVVVLFHTLRLVSVITLMPFLSKVVIKWIGQ